MARSIIDAAERNAEGTARWHWSRVRLFVSVVLPLIWWWMEATATRAYGEGGAGFLLDIAAFTADNQNGSGADIAALQQAAERVARRRQVRNRWRLALMLLRNPRLKSYRAHRQRWIG